MWQRFTERARKVVFYAQEEASLLGGNWVSTEHLLLSLVRQNDNVAVQILGLLGVSQEQVREGIGRHVLRAGGQVGKDMQLTARAKQVIDFAFQEARDLDSHYIGTEHLLLGIMRYVDGLAGQTLVGLGLEANDVRREARELNVGAEVAAKDTAPLEMPETFEMSPVAPINDAFNRLFSGDIHESALPSSIRGGTVMWQRFTERARKVVFYAQEEAGQLGENYVSTEHLLLGLIRENDSVAARILDHLGLSLARIRSEIERQVARGDGRLSQDMQLTPRAKRVIDLAYDEARQLNNNYIGTEHLLLGLIREGDGLAGRVLTELGVDLDRTRGEIQDLQGNRETKPQGLMRRLGDIFKDNNEVEQGQAGSEMQGKPSQRMAPPRGRSPIADVLTEHRLRGRDILGIEPLTREEILLILAVAARLKDNKFDATQTQFAQGQTLAMLFEKPSLRTRVTFEAGMNQMGGHAIYLEGRLGVRETVPDVARNLDRWIDGIMARTFDHQTVIELAEYANIPVVNGLSDREHPCQAFADFQTLAERKGTLEGLKLAYVGDGNNVAHSLMLLAAKVGTHFSLSCPEGYEPDQALWQAALGFAAETGAVLTLTHDPTEGVREADAVYTDVWASMGQEGEAAARAVTFAPFQVNAALMAHAKPDALVMHCLPAHRGEEITADVLDGPNSVVFDQAENRLHAQKAVLSLVL